MRLRFFCLMITLFCLVACAPTTRSPLPAVKVDGRARAECAKVFPKGHWQFVHSIDFRLEGGSGTTVIGVSNLDGDAISCALITLEGLTLFEATCHADRRLEVGRAVPPFDRPGFAQGLIADIRTIFQAPQGQESSGYLKDGSGSCRFTEPDGSVIDVLLAKDACWQIKRYSAELVLDRRITAGNCTKKEPDLIPDVIELTGYGRRGYSLKMTLIRADYFP